MNRKVYEYLSNHPDKSSLPASAVAKEIGVCESLVRKTRREMRGNAAGCAAQQPRQSSRAAPVEISADDLLNKYDPMRKIQRRIDEIRDNVCIPKADFICMCDVNATDFGSCIKSGMFDDCMVEPIGARNTFYFCNKATAKRLKETRRFR